MKSENNKIQIMLASGPKILSEVIKNIVEHQPDMEIVGEVIDPIKLLAAVKLLSVDVVIITPKKTNGEPRICRHLLEEHPSLKIIVLSANGEAGFLYQSDAHKIQIDDPSEDAILNVLRTSIY